MRRLLTAGLALALAAATPALSDDAIIPWKNVSGWQVAMDSSLGNGCFIAAFYDEGTALRLGFDFSEGRTQLYLALGNDKWKSLEAGKDYPIEIQFDNNPVWQANATVTNLPNAKFLIITTQDTTFATEFSRKLTMRASFQGRQITRVKLKSSATAIGEMLKCQQAVELYAKKEKPAPAVPADPFKTAPDTKSASDPFEL